MKSRIFANQVIIILVLLLIATSFAQALDIQIFDAKVNNSKIELCEKKSTSHIVYSYKYDLGEVVRCSKWKNGSYWEGKVVERKEGVYKIEICRVVVEGFMTLYLNANPCTGKKRLSYKDGTDYNSTEIWVREMCMDGKN